MADKVTSSTSGQLARLSDCSSVQRMASCEVASTVQPTQLSNDTSSRRRQILETRSMARSLICVTLPSRSVRNRGIAFTRSITACATHLSHA